MKPGPWFDSVVAVPLVFAADSTDTDEEEKESVLEEEQLAIGIFFLLHDIKYDADGNQVNTMVDYKEDPVLQAEELVAYNEAWVWGIVEATPELAEKDFNVRIMVIITVEEWEEDEIIHWGTARYVAEEDEYYWRDGPGMEILE